jgi:hypothetical protein
MFLSNKKTMFDKYDIEVLQAGKSVSLTIEPLLKGTATIYNVLKQEQMIFSAECCSDEVGDTLKLTPEYQDKGLDKKLVDDVIDIIQSEEE